MRSFTKIFASLLLFSTLSVMSVDAQRHRDTHQAKEQSTRRGNRSSNGNSSVVNNAHRKKDPAVARPAHGNTSTPDRPNGNGNRPGGNQGHNPGGNGNRPGNNQGHNPGGSGNRPGGNQGHNPNGNGNRPGNNQGHNPGGVNPGHNPGHNQGGNRPGGNAWRPGNNFGPGHVPRPPHMPPPQRPGRPININPWHRPTPPPTWRPYIGAPSFATIMGITLGTAIGVSLDYLINSGYTVDGYTGNQVYLRNVNQLNYMWPDATLYYGPGGLTGSEFMYSTVGYNTSRYYSIYNNLIGLYGPPATILNPAGGMGASWFGPNGAFVTLQFLPRATYSGTRYFTTLSFGM